MTLKGFESKLTAVLGKYGTNGVFLSAGSFNASGLHSGLLLLFQRDVLSHDPHNSIIILVQKTGASSIKNRKSNPKRINTMLLYKGTVTHQLTAYGRIAQQPEVETSTVSDRRMKGKHLAPIFSLFWIFFLCSCLYFTKFFTQ